MGAKAAEPSFPAETPEPSLSLNDLGLISRPSLANVLNKSIRTVQRMTERGELPPTISMARDQYYRRESVVAYLAERERKAAQRKQPRPTRARPTGAAVRRAS